MITGALKRVRTLGKILLSAECFKRGLYASEEMMFKILILD